MTVGLPRFTPGHEGPILSGEQRVLAVQRQLGRALELIDVRLLDHILVTDGSFVSLADRGARPNGRPPDGVE